MRLPFPNQIKHPTNALYIEHEVQRIITQQEINGVYYHKARGRFYIHALREKQEELYRKIRPHLSLELEVPDLRSLHRPFKKDGSYTAIVQRWFEGADVSVVSGPFDGVRYSEPDLSKRGKLVAQLLRLGWRPSGYTEKGNPKLKVDGAPCPNLEKIDSEVGKWIADWYVYRHREGQIAGFDKLVRGDGRISASAITIGTPTYRFRHRGVVNVPTRGLFGKQMRSLFGINPKEQRDRVLFGWDASGLELRMLADAINDTLFTKEVLDGDIHSKNQRDARLPTRNDAKTFIYAFIYGAGDAKLGSIIGGGRVAGARIRKQFLLANPKLADCIKSTKSASERGYLIGIDGRRVTMRRDKVTGQVQTHKALNTRLQCGGAVVMKWAMVLLDEWIVQYGLDALKVIDMHDEAQYDVARNDAPMMAILAPLAIKTAGEMLDLNCALDGDTAIGTNWSQTH